MNSFVLEWSILDDLVESPKTFTPADAGVQNSLNLLDSRFRGNDKMEELRLFTKPSFLAISRNHNDFSRSAQTSERDQGIDTPP